MDVKYINPFLDSFMFVLPQMGVKDIKRGKLELKGKIINSPGVMIILGLMGDFRGNVMYGMSIECAKKIASDMMMGMDVPDFNDIAQSAISELTNMLTANACIIISNTGCKLDISTPTLMRGDFTATANTDSVLCVEMLVNEMPFEINISIDKV